jgi:hypothetical protein
MSAGTPTILTKVLRGFPQSLQVNAGLTPQIKPRLFAAIAFPIHFSLPFSVMCSETLKASLNKSGNSLRRI